MVFLAWAGVTAGWSLDPANSLDRLGKLILLVLLGSGCLAAASLAPMPDRAARCTAAALGAAVVAGLLLILGQRATDGQLFVYLGAADPHPIPDYLLRATNKGATVLAVVALPAAILSARVGGLGAAWAVFLAGLAAAALSGSTAALAALVVGALATALSHFGGRRARRLIVAAVLVGILLAPPLLATVPAPLGSARDAVAQRIDLPWSLLHRTYIYDFTLARIAERPILGWGLDAVSRLPGGQDTVPGHPDAPYLPRHAHNLVLQVWVELGAVGALLLAWFAWSVFRGIERRFVGAMRDAMTGGALAFAVVSVLSYAAYASWWIATGFLLAAFMLRLAPRPIRDQA
ncbi:MAG: O-antigen ligase family protein [Proteobacteria bacterium]|nr:O-antigen ligase family protein [Pseudomonadota bacterium]